MSEEPRETSDTGASPASRIEPTRVELRRTPLWTPFVTFAVGIGALMSLETVLSVVPDIALGLPVETATAVRVAALSILFAGIPVGVIGWRVYLHRKPLPPITLDDEFIELPRSLHGGPARRVAYRDLLSLHVTGQTPFSRVFVESRTRVFHFPQHSFADPLGPELVFREVRRRMMRLPDGDQLLESISNRQNVAAETLSGRPFATQALLGLLIVFYLNQSMLGSFERPLSSIRWGALSAPLVADGELFRLLSASFLHGNWLHIAINGIALYSLGGIMERLLGLPRYLVLYLVSGLGATVASVLAGTPAAVGASGAIFGLFGGLAFVNWRYRSWLPFPFRQSVAWWAFIIGINALLPILLPIIDVAAHLGGFVVGGLVTWAIVDRSRELMPAPPPTAGIRVLALALAAAYLVGLGTSVYYAATSDRSVEVDVLRRIGHDHPQYISSYLDELTTKEDLDFLRGVIEDKDIKPGLLNELAWMLAVSKEADEEKLNLAELAAQRFMREVPDAPGLQDTYATVLYRQGKLDEAIRIQRRVVEDETVPGWISFLYREAGQSTYRSQLARFINARFERDGAIVAGTVDPQALTLRIRGPSETEEPGPANRPSLVVQLAEEFENGLNLYAVARRGDELVGLLRLELGPKPARRYSYSPNTRVDLDRGVELHLALVEEGSGQPTGKQKWSFWAMTPDVAALP